MPTRLPGAPAPAYRALRAFFERIIEWDWPDAPPRNPVPGGDIPKKPEPLPKFLDDRDAAKVMAAARACADPRDRLVIELLARTGMRAGELTAALDTLALTAHNIAQGKEHLLDEVDGQPPQETAW